MWLFVEKAGAVREIEDGEVNTSRRIPRAGNFKLVRDGLNAFVNLDVDLAYQVIGRDDVVDAINVKVIDQLTEVMQQHAEWVVPALHCFSAARHLERIADHATNVAEDVVYLVGGVIVRHRHLPPQASD